DRDQEEVVVGLPEHLTLLIQKAHHGVRVVADLDPLVDRILAWKEPLPDVVPDHDDVGGMLAVGIRQKSALRHESVLSDRILLHHSEDPRRAQLRVAVPGVDFGVVPEIPLGRHGADLGDRAQCGGVLERQVLAAQLSLGPRPARAESGLVFLEHDERCPEALEIADHVVVEARDDRDHRDDGPDTHHDAEDGQGGAQLVRPDGQQRESDVLAEAPPETGRARHSYRSDSIGSSLEALTAGYRPKKIPTESETRSPTRTAQRGVSAGRASNAFLSPAAIA